jgi:hypothetical protein
MTAGEKQNSGAEVLRVKKMGFAATGKGEKTGYTLPVKW